MVISVLYLLSEDNTIALYLHFMNIQGNMLLVTLQNLSSFYGICCRQIMFLGRSTSELMISVKHFVKGKTSFLDEHSALLPCMIVCCVDLL